MRTQMEALKDYLSDDNARGERTSQLRDHIANWGFYDLTTEDWDRWYPFFSRNFAAHNIDLVIDELEAEKRRASKRKGRAVNFQDTGFKRNPIMGQRKVKEIEVGDVVAKIYKDSDTGEHIAKFWERGERRNEWDYFGDSLGDAVGTARDVLIRVAGAGRPMKTTNKPWTFGVIQSGGRDTNGNPRQAIALYDANGSELAVIDVGYLGASQAVAAEGYAKPFTKDGGPLVRSYGVMKAREFNQWIANSKRKANPAKRKTNPAPKKKAARKKVPSIVFIKKGKRLHYFEYFEKGGPRFGNSKTNAYHFDTMADAKKVGKEIALIAGPQGYTVGIGPGIAGASHTMANIAGDRAEIHKKELARLGIKKP